MKISVRGWSGLVLADFVVRAISTLAWLPHPVMVALSAALSLFHLALLIPVMLLLSRIAIPHIAQLVACLLTTNVLFFGLLRIFDEKNLQYSERKVCFGVGETNCHWEKMTPEWLDPITLAFLLLQLAANVIPILVLSNWIRGKHHPRTHSVSSSN